MKFRNIEDICFLYSPKQKHYIEFRNYEQKHYNMIVSMPNRKMLLTISKLSLMVVTCEYLKYTNGDIMGTFTFKPRFDVTVIIKLTRCEDDVQTSQTRTFLFVN